VIACICLFFFLTFMLSFDVAKNNNDNNNNNNNNNNITQYEKVHRSTMHALGKLMLSNIEIKKIS